jgi:hypothetical protein
MNVQELVRWAWQDPAGRVQPALLQVREMAADATGPYLAELQDAGTMLSRLASSLDTEPVNGEGTILGQLAGDTITSQLIELAVDAWRREKRGPHGEWIRGAPYAGPMPKSRADRIRRMQAAQAKRQAATAPAITDDEHIRQLIQTEVARRVPAAAVPASAAAPETAEAKPMTAEEARKILEAIPLLPGEDKAKHMNPLPHETPRENVLHEQQIHQRLVPYAENKANQVMEAAKAHVASEFARAAKEADTEAGKAARKKAITEAGITIATAILAGLGTMVGLPVAVAIAAPAVLMLIQIGIEWKNRL